MISASKRTKTSLDHYVRNSEDVSSLNPFELHIFILENALVNWRQYITDLTDKVTQQVRESLLPCSFKLKVRLTRTTVRESNRSLYR